MYDEYQTIEGMGLGIKATGEVAADTTTYYGIELQGIENLEVRLTSGDDIFTIEDVDESLRVTVVAGDGNDSRGARKNGQPL